jgi:phosphoribosyl 1,2-cyclic phosphodiesterase
VLIDAGLSAKETEDRLEKLSVDPSELQGILISHEHIDHLRSAGILSRRYKMPLFMNKATLSAAKGRLGRVDQLEIFETSKKFQLMDFVIEPFSVLHDAADPVCFCVCLMDRKLGIATDLGKSTALVRQMLRQSHVLILESNHDSEMLLSGPYPWWLKQRIRGTLGHLSNDDSQSLLREVLHQELKHVVLAHLSEKNNHCALARQSAEQVLQEREDIKVDLNIAGQHQIGEIIEI